MSGWGRRVGGLGWDWVVGVEVDRGLSGWGDWRRAFLKNIHSKI